MKSRRPTQKPGSVDSADQPQTPPPMNQKGDECECFFGKSKQLKRDKAHRVATHGNTMFSVCRKFFLASSFLVLVVHGFGSSTRTSSGTSGSPRTNKPTPSVANQAIDVFGSLYPFGREPPKRSAFVDFGMPDRDLDGTKLKRGGGGKRLSDISEKQARAAFAELSKLYGDENALKMVKIQPLVLAFDSKLFRPSLKEFSEIFGIEEAKSMVLRNPGLLAVPPAEAARTTDQTMTFSYLLALTRPISGVGVPGLLALLLVPAVEKLTGVDIRGALFSGLPL